MAQKFEVWLQSNRRALWGGAIAPVLMLLLGLAVALNVMTAAPVLARIAAGAIALLGGVLLAVLAWYARQPRLAYDGRHLLVYIRTGRPISVPIEIVECFLLGSGLRDLGGGRQLQIAQLGIRLSERATDWHQFDVKQALGKWCGGYITMNGAWCEPLTLALVQQLNARLATAHKEHRDTELLPAP